MATYTDWICERVFAGEPEAFLGAHEVVREFRVRSPDGGGCEPWASRIKADPPTSTDLEMIRSALLDALVNGNDLAVSGAAFALAEFQDSALAPLLREQLHRHLRAMTRLHSGMHNLLVALASSGEELSRLPSAISVDDAIQLARVCLQQAGEKVVR